MYVSLLRVMATIARITTTSRAAAMTTAAVGLRPKMVVRSVTAERGSAEPSSLRAGVWVSVLRSMLTWPLTSPLGVETEPLAPDEPGGGAGVVAGAWVPAGLLPLCASATVTTPNAASAMSRATAMLFMLHLLRG